MSKTVQMCVGGLGLLLSTTALADFVVRAPDKPAAETPASKVQPPQVPAAGLVDAATLYARSAPQAVGFADNLPLGEALRLLLPAGWHAEATPGLAQTRVSWQGGAAWPVVLQRLASSQGWTMQLDVAAQRVRLAAAAKPAPVATPAPAETAVAKPAEKLPATPVWQVKSGQLLGDVMTDWSRRAGWQLQDPQHLLDYRLGADARFQGEFQQAVEQLIEALGLSEPTLVVDFYAGNRQLRISAAASGAVR